MIRTKADFLRYFRTDVLPAVREQYEQDRSVDVPARRETWNNLIDAMVQDRELPRHAVAWVCPW